MKSKLLKLVLFLTLGATAWAIFPPRGLILTHFNEYGDDYWNCFAEPPYVDPTVTPVTSRTLADGLVIFDASADPESAWYGVTIEGATIDKTNRKLIIPAAPEIQRTRQQTNSVGAYSWTFPTAYGSGVTPIISAVCEGASSSTWNVQITSVSNTGVTVQVTRTTPVTVVGVSVLGVSLSPQTYVHLTAIAP